MQAVSSVCKERAKGEGSKTVLRSMLSIDPPDHCGRDLKGTAFHPYRDRILLWRRAQVDHIGASRRSLGGCWWCLDRCRPNGGDICRRRCEREPLWCRGGVGGCHARWLWRGMPATWGLMGRGPSGLGCREIGCGESRWRGLGARRSHLIQERLHALDARGERPNRLRDRVDPLGQGFSALTAPAELVLHLSELTEALGDPWGVVHGPCAV